MKTLEYIGKDGWSRPEYVDVKTKKHYVDVDMTKDPRYPLSLHTVTPEWGEPDCPVHFKFEVIGWTDEQQEQHNFEFEYMLLDRLRQDCNYEIGNDIISDDSLWQLARHNRIMRMRSLWNMLPVKPKWLSMEQIDEYEKELCKDVIDIINR